MKTLNLAAHSFLISESKTEKSCKFYILHYYELPGSGSNLKYFDSLRSLKSSSAFSLHLLEWISRSKCNIERELDMKELTVQLKWWNPELTTKSKWDTNLSVSRIWQRCLPCPSGVVLKFSDRQLGNSEKLKRHSSSFITVWVSITTVVFSVWLRNWAKLAYFNIAPGNLIIPLKYLHVFSFSKRERKKKENWISQIPVRHRRWSKVKINKSPVTLHLLFEYFTYLWSNFATWLYLDAMANCCDSCFGFAC